MGRLGEKIKYLIGMLGMAVLFCIAGQAIAADHQFDMGPAGSPVAPGYTQITIADVYNSGAGYGWIIAPQYDQVLGWATSVDPLWADEVGRYYTSGPMEFAVDVPPGVYEVRVITGDNGDHRISTLTAEYGALLTNVTEIAFRPGDWDRPDLATTTTLADGTSILVDTLKFQQVWYIFDVTVTDGQLNVSMVGDSVAREYAMIAGLDVVFVGEVSLNTLPVAACKDITVTLGENGEAAITANDVDGGSFDSDGDSITKSIDIDTFDCDNVGAPVTVTLTVSDGKLTDTCEAEVTVVDNLAPEVTGCELIQVDGPGRSINSMPNASANFRKVDLSNVSVSDNCSVVDCQEN